MIKRITGLLFLTLALSVSLSAQSLGTTSTITQGGIVWTFDTTYTYGTYANGDYWVVGPLTVNSITPNSSGSGSTARHGWMVNPSNIALQALDGRADDGVTLDYDAALMPALPYAASAGESLVKANSVTTGTNCSTSNAVRCLTEVSVLTVVSGTPTGGGEFLFRPPFVGTTKTSYAADTMQTNLLPSLASVGSPSSITTYKNIWKGPQVEFWRSQNGCNLRPINSYSVSSDSYQPYSARDQADAVLRTFLSDSVADKLPLVITMVQGGIDRFAMVANGQTWWDNDCGFGVGHKITMAYAALMLNDATMQSTLAADDRSKEATCVSLNANSVPVFGKCGKTGTQADFNFATKLAYWQYVNTVSPAGNFLEAKDPYNQTDSTPQANYNYAGISATPAVDLYQVCCTFFPFKAQSLIMSLLSGVQSFWGNTANFMGYTERMVSHGALHSPDTCAPIDPVDLNVAYASWTKYGITWGDSGGNCITGSGRFPASDGGHVNGANGGSYGSAFQTAMYNAYYVPYNSSAPVPGNSGTLTISNLASTTATVNWSAASCTGTCQYEVGQSTSPISAGVTACEATSIIRSFTNSITSFDVTSLTPFVHYYWCVVVTDTTLLKAAYTPVDDTTICVPTYVAYTSQPVSAALGASIGTVTIGVYTAGVLCTAASSSVTLSGTVGNTWNGLASVLNPTLTKTVSSGLASWTDLKVNTTIGVGTITAASSGLTDGISSSISIGTAPVPVTGGGAGIRTRWRVRGPIVDAP